MTEIVAFSKAYDRAHFNCGKPELDTWLKEHAGQQERTGNTTTFLAVDGSRAVVGYYSTTTYRLDLDEAARAFGLGKSRYPVPAVLLQGWPSTNGCMAGDWGPGYLSTHSLRSPTPQGAWASRSSSFTP